MREAERRTNKSEIASRLALRTRYQAQALAQTQTQTQNVLGGSSSAQKSVSRVAA